MRHCKQLVAIHLLENQTTAKERMSFNRVLANINAAIANKLAVTNFFARIFCLEEFDDCVVKLEECSLPKRKIFCNYWQFRYFYAVFRTFVFSTPVLLESGEDCVYVEVRFRESTNEA